MARTAESGTITGNSRLARIMQAPSLVSRNFRSPLRYPGGKQRAIDQIARLLPSKVAEYREPMVGGGSVYFYAKTMGIADTYWINDQFAELYHFWQTVKDAGKCIQLMKQLEDLRLSFKSADEIKSYFMDVRNERPEDACRQAFLFFFFNRVTFSGTTRAGGFSKSASLGRFTQSSIQRLSTLPDALDGTKITNGDFQPLIESPGKDVFVFLDPPYYKASKLYGRNGELHQFDHERLASLLRHTQHRFLITYDDCSEIRGLYKWATIREWQLQYGMNNCNEKNLSKIGSELFISNY
jgi:DNA adenine methylase